MGDADLLVYLNPEPIGSCSEIDVGVNKAECENNKGEWTPSNTNAGTEISGRTPKHHTIFGNIALWVPATETWLHELTHWLGIGNHSISTSNRMYPYSADRVPDKWNSNGRVLKALYSYETSCATSYRETEWYGPLIAPSVKLANQVDACLTFLRRLFRGLKARARMG